MAALTITATSVVRVLTGNAPTRAQRGTAGATITAGQLLYLDTNGKLQVAAKDSAVHANVIGLALNGGAVNQPIEYAIPDGGQVDVGATVEVGKLYAAAATGGIMPVDDIAQNDYITYVGVGQAANRFSFKVHASGVQAASAVA